MGLWVTFGKCPSAQRSRELTENRASDVGFELSEWRSLYI